MENVEIIEDSCEPLVEGMVRPSIIRERFQMSEENKNEILNMNYKFALSAFGEIVYYDKYSRLKQNGTKEKWPETVLRVTEGAMSIAKDHMFKNGLRWNNKEWDELAFKMAKNMLEFKWLPGGRGLFCCGTEFVYENGGSALNNCTFVSTQGENKDFLQSLTYCADSLMCGSGVGFDTRWNGDIYLPGCKDCRYPSLENLSEISQCNCQKLLYKIHDSRQGWVQSIYHLMKSYLFENERSVLFDYSKIRQPGTPLKKFGGTSSGYTPLYLLHKDMRAYLECFIESKSNVFNAAKNLCERLNLNIDTSIYDDMEEIQSFCHHLKRFKNISLEETGFFKDFDINKLVKFDPEFDVAKFKEGDTLNKSYFNERLPILMNNTNKEHTQITLIANLFNSIGKCVVSGNIRRSSEICLGFYGTEFLNLKNYILNVERVSVGWMSNNTVMLAKTEDFKYLPIIAERIKVNGEPGIMNCLNFGKGRVNHKAYGPREGEKDHAIGLNPCITGENIIQTSTGYFCVTDLIGKQFIVLVNGIKYASTENGFWSSGIKKIVKVTLENGSSFRCTDNHKFCNAIENDELTWVELRTIYETDKILILENGSLQKIISMIEDGEEEVYDCTIPNLGYFVMSNGVLTKNCGEITLSPFENCNLSEIYLDNLKNYDEMKESITYATIYSTIISLVNTCWYESNRIINKNRRIGVSLSNLAEACEKIGHGEMVSYLRALKKVVTDVNVKYADIFSIMPAIRSTTIKPSGTTNLIGTSASPGLHFSIGNQFYIRRLRLSTASELLPSLIDAGYNYVVDDDSPNTLIFSFPIKRTSNSRCASDVSAWEQLMMGISMQSNYSDNSVSQTIYFNKETESHEVEKILALSLQHLKNISMYPMSKNTTAYKNPPYEDIDQEKYDEMIKDLKPINWDNIGSKAKDAEISKYCDGDKCIL